MIDIETRRLYDRLNRRLAKFDKAGVTNNTIDLIKHELQLAYEGMSADIDLRNIRFDRFTMSKNLTKQQQAELTAIAEAMDNIKSSNLSYYIKNKETDDRFLKAYETVKDKYNEVTDLQSYIDFIDKAKNSVAVSVLKQLMDSDQAMRASYYADKKGLSDKDLNKLIVNNYKKFTDGDQLYLFLVDEIDKKYKKKTKTSRATGSKKATGRKRNK